MPVTRNQSNATAQAKASSMDTAGPSDRGDGDVQGSSDSVPARPDSPDNCSICLGPFNDKSFTSSCAHSFCFVCLKQWSKVKAECPLCKQPFTNIFHNIRSNQSYDVYDLPLNPTRQQPDFITPYDLYATGPSIHFTPIFMPELDADLTLGNFSRFQFRHNRSLLPGASNFQNEHPYAFSMLSSSQNHVSAATWLNGAEDFRRSVYRHHMGPPVHVLGTENSNYILTPAMVQASAHRIHRIMPWLIRELRVLLRNLHSIRLAISVIQPLLSRVMINSPVFRERVAPLIGRRANAFIREFVTFANSAMTIQQYDRKAMYRRREAPLSSSQMAMYDAGSSSSNSSSDDDVVEVTAISPGQQPVASSSSTSMPTLPPPPPYPADVSGSVTFNLPSSSGTQMEIAEDRVSVSSESDDPVFRPDQQDVDSDNSRAGSDIVFLKFDKPWNERSPIRLSSDSEREGPDDRKSRKKKTKRKKKRHSDDPGSSKKKTQSKSSKGKGKSKQKPLPQEIEPESCSSSRSEKQNRSCSPSDRRASKKRKRSSDHPERQSHDQDRDLVDRYCAKAFYQQFGSHASEMSSCSVTASSRSKEKLKRSSDKPRHKKKHKRRHSSQSAYPQSYKKHPSGHKKSSDARRRNADSNMDRPHHRPAESNPTSGQTSSSQPPELQDMQPAPSSSSYNYMALPETVQHIPLNLWVGTWPSLPHMSFPGTTGPSRPMATSSPAPPSQPMPPDNTRVSEDSQTVSSDSSADSDEDTDDTQDSEIPCSSSSSLAQTKQWLESSSFAEVANTQSGTTEISQETIASTFPGTSTSTAISSARNGPEPIDVLTIDSEEEDCVVVSNSESDSENEVCVTNVERAIGAEVEIATSQAPCEAASGEISTTSVISIDSDSSSLVPGPSRRIPPIRIKLNRPPNIQVSKFFNTLDDSDSEDQSVSSTWSCSGAVNNCSVTSGESAILTYSQSQSVQMPQACSNDSSAPVTSAGVNENSQPIVSLHTGSTMTTSMGPVMSSLYPQMTTPSRPPLFPVLPSLPRPNPPRSALSTSLRYLPYPSLPMTTQNHNMASFTVPTVSGTLPLAFSYPTLPPPILPPPPSAMLPPMFAPPFSPHALTTAAGFSNTQSMDSTFSEAGSMDSCPVPTCDLTGAHALSEPSVPSQLQGLSESQDLPQDLGSTSSLALPTWPTTTALPSMVDNALSSGATAANRWSESKENSSTQYRERPQNIELDESGENFESGDVPSRNAIDSNNSFKQNRNEQVNVSSEQPIDLTCQNTDQNCDSDSNWSVIANAPSETSQSIMVCEADSVASLNESTWSMDATFGSVSSFLQSEPPSEVDSVDRSNQSIVAVYGSSENESDTFQAPQSRILQEADNINSIDTENKSNSASSFTEPKAAPSENVSNKSDEQLVIGICFDQSEDDSQCTEPKAAPSENVSNNSDEQLMIDIRFEESEDDSQCTEPNAVPSENISDNSNAPLVIGVCFEQSEDDSQCTEPPSLPSEDPPEDMVSQHDRPQDAEDRLCPASPPSLWSRESDQEEFQDALDSQDD